MASDQDDINEKSIGVDEAILDERASGARSVELNVPVTQIKTLGDIDALYREIRRRSGSRAGYDAVYSAAKEIDVRTLQYILLMCDKDIAQLEKPYMLDFMIPAVAALIGAVGAVTAAMASALVGMASIMASSSHNDYAIVNTGMLAGPLVKVALLASLALFLAAVLPIAIHKLSLHRKYERLFVQRAALSEALREVSHP